MNRQTKICVTGATGFIGRKLCIELARKGFRVHALCRDTSHSLIIPHTNITFFKGDILDKASLNRAMAGCERVYHTAAIAKMWCLDLNDFYTVNVIGTRNVLETAIQCNVRKVVHTSTCGVWGPVLNHPVSETDPRTTGFPIHYERTKYLAELEVSTFVKKGLDVVIVNPSRVYGEGPITESNTVGKMVSGYANGKWRIIPGNGESVANYAFLDDVVRGHLAAMEHGRTGNRYILGGEDISFNQFFETLTQVSGKHTKMFRVPLNIIKLYSQVQWLKTTLTRLPPVFLPEFANRLKSNQKYSSAKAIKELNYTITPFWQGLKKTVDYFNTNLI
ncbi:MAG TPA: SDR family oxidoreductase [Pedobacter sp.]|jgi:nucleoside-diphosphate-sugar epimerase